MEEIDLDREYHGSFTVKIDSNRRIMIPCRLHEIYVNRVGEENLGFLIGIERIDEEYLELRDSLPKETEYHRVFKLNLDDKNRFSLSERVIGIAAELFSGAESVIVAGHKDHMRVSRND